MEGRKTISENGECIIAEMEQMQYAPLTMEYFRYDVRRWADFVRQRTGEEFFREELGRIYTENKWLTTQGRHGCAVFVGLANTDYMEL